MGVFHVSDRKAPCRVVDVIDQLSIKELQLQFQLTEKHSCALFQRSTNEIIFLHNPTNREEWNERLIGAYYSSLVAKNEVQPLNFCRGFRASHNSAMIDYNPTMPSIETQISHFNIRLLELDIFGVSEVECNCLFHLGHNSPGHAVNSCDSNPDALCLEKWLSTIKKFTPKQGPLFVMLDIKNTVSTEHLDGVEQIFYELFGNNLLGYRDLESLSFVWPKVS